mmetsp:Transcript_108663/g.302052  ORF Transcript_108663/g.302052 Transcript_108663/m.302052 type:complete len:256 (+) Transcript_108663:322-1089(+)
MMMTVARAAHPLPCPCTPQCTLRALLEGELAVLKRPLHHLGELVDVDLPVAVLVGLADDVLHVIVAHHLAQAGQRVAQLGDRDGVAVVAVNELEDVVRQLLAVRLGGRLLGGKPVEELVELDGARVVHVDLADDELRHHLARVGHAQQLEHRTHVLGAHLASGVPVEQCKGLHHLLSPLQVARRGTAAVGALGGARDGLAHRRGVVGSEGGPLVVMAGAAGGRHVVLGVLAFAVGLVDGHERQLAARALLTRREE